MRTSTPTARSGSIRGCGASRWQRPRASSRRRANPSRASRRSRAAAAGQQGWAGPQQPPQSPQQPPQGGWGNQPGQQSWSGQPQPYGAPQGQHPNPYGPPQQQGWPGQGQQAPPTQQWGGAPQGQPPTQQWGGQQQSWNQGQPGYGQAPDAGSAPRKRSKKPLVIGGIIALLIAAAAVVLFWVPGLLAPKVFDEKAVAAGVTTVLTRDYGLQNVTGVTCPANTSVKAGATFTCDATIDGDASKVEIKILDAQGKYEVGRPAA